MLPDQVSNPGPLIYESGALLIALHGPAQMRGHNICVYAELTKIISTKIIPNIIKYSLLSRALMVSSKVNGTISELHQQ